MKLSKFILMFSIIYFSVNITCSALAATSTPLHIEFGAEVDVSGLTDSTTYPHFLTKKSNESSSMILFHGIHRWSAYVIPKNLSLLKNSYWKLNDYYAITIEVEPLYSPDFKNISVVRAPTKGLLKNEDPYFYFQSNPYDGSVDPSKDAKDLGALGGSFTVSLYALKKPIQDLSIKTQTIAALSGLFGGDGQEPITGGGKAEIILKGFTATQKPKTCNILNKNITINMEKVILKDFSNKNEIYGGENTFNLKCDDGFNRIIYVSMKDANHNESSNYLTSKGSASGFGVSLYHDGKKIQFSPNPDSKSEFKLTEKNGGYSIPLKAFYVKEAESASAGTVNSLAQLTLRYE